MVNRRPIINKLLVINKLEAHFGGPFKLNNMNELLENYEKQLKSHDWYYMMADDNRYYQAGRQSETRIRKSIEELKDNDLTKEAKEIWFKHAPKAPFSEEQFKFLG